MCACTPYVFTISMFRFTSSGFCQKRNVVIINLLTKGKMQSFITSGLWNREVDDENRYKNLTEQLFPVEIVQIATLAAGKRSKAKTLHCNPASLRELVIKTHTHFLFLQSTGCCLPASGTLVCVSALL